MQFLRNHLSKVIASDFFHLNVLHILNDGFAASIILLLPFIAFDQGLNLAQVGLLGTVLKIASVAFALPGAYFASRFGGLKILVTTAFVYGIVFLAIGGTGQFYLLLPLFILAGIGFGSFHPIAFALIAKWTPKEKRGRAMGDFTAIGDLGRIGIAAALSFLAVAVGWHYTAVIYGGLAIIAAAFFYRYLFSSSSKVQLKKEEKPATKLSIWQVLKNKRYVLTLCSAGLDTFANSSLFVFLPFLLLERHISPALLGAFTATFFVGTFFGKALLGRFVDKIGGVKVFIMAEVLMALFIYLLVGASAIPVIIICSIILGVFTKGTVPVLQSMVSESVEHHGNYEKAYGIESMVSDTGGMLAPLILGLVADQFGIDKAFYVMAASALLASIPAVWFYFTGRRRRLLHS